MSPFTDEPLLAAQKMELLSLAAQMTAPKLQRSEMAVLTQIAQHQNTKTGQCNPSVDHLCRVLGLGRRTVQSALKTLQAAKLIKVHRTPGRSNSYTLASPELRKSLGAEVRANGAHVEQDGVRPTAQEGAMDSARDAQPTAPKKEKEKGKEKRAARRRRQDAENGLKDALGRQGISYEDVIGLPTDLLEEIHVELAFGKTTLKQASRRIVDALIAR